MGEIEKGKIRNNYVLLCDSCGRRAEAAIQIVETARDVNPNNSPPPDFLKDLFGKFGK